MFVSAGARMHLHAVCAENDVESFAVQQQASTSKIVSLSLCNDNSYLAALRENELPQIFAIKDKQSARPVVTINVPNISAITFKHHTKKHIALGNKSGDVIIYDTKRRVLTNTFPNVAASIKHLDYTCEDEELCGLTSNTLFVFVDVNKTSTLKKYPQPNECTYLKCHPFISNRVAIATKIGTIGIWDVSTGAEIISINALPSPITGISMSSCGNFLIACGDDLKICGLDFKTSSCSFQYHIEQEYGVSASALSPDDKFVAVGLRDGTLKLYDVRQQMKQVFSSKVYDTPVNVVVFENKALESNSNFSSMLLLTEEVKEDSKASSVNDKPLKSCLPHRDPGLDMLKKSVYRVMKMEMDALQNQLEEHCNRFQKFMENEFETIDGIIRKKWDIFNVGDVNQIMKAICPDPPS